MKFNQELSNSGIAIHAYEPDRVTLRLPGDRRRELDRSFILSPQRLVEAWSVTDIGDLNDEALAVVSEFEAEVILLGTGTEHTFPSAERLATLYRLGVGVEVMSSHAACHTYNILAEEGRQVVAAIIL